MAVDTIEVPANGGQGKGSVSGLAASKCGLMAVLEENDRKLLIYNQERNDVLEFPLDSPLFSYANQLAFDRHHNIVIAQGDQKSLLRYNMNGKALPSLEVPENINCPTGVACSPDGDLYVASNDLCIIAKQTAGESGWITLYRSKDVDYDDYDEFDPAQFAPGQLSFGGDGELFVATDNCINVLRATDGKFKRQIGCDKYRDGELAKVEGIFVTGDGYLFACDQEYCIHAFTSAGEYLCKFGGFGKDLGQFRQPWGITVDWSGHLLVSDMGNGRIQVY